MRSPRGMMRRAGGEEEHPSRSYDYRVAARLLAYVRPYRLLVSVSVLSALVLAATIVTTPWLIQRAVDSIVSEGSTRGLTLAAVFLAVNALVGYGSNYLHLTTLSRVGQNLVVRTQDGHFQPHSEPLHVLLR